jgi:hypothetical protein
MLLFAGCGLGLWCACIGNHWALWSAKRGGIVRGVYGLGGLRQWCNGSVGLRMVSVRLCLKLGSPGSVWVTREQGVGGVESGAGRRARWCDARDRSVCVHGASLWAVRSHRGGIATARRRVGPRGQRCVELVVGNWVSAMAR